ncbi:MAG: hypothetical protein NXI18_12975 [Alphaproteobacteria bacterium]|nr:hypothetical protein [Alphaproteobacteria bacterium]
MTADARLPTSLYMLRGENFTAYVGDVFWLETVQGPLEMRLVDVKIGAAPLFHGTDRCPFSLLFNSPPGDYSKTEGGMANLRHKKLGLVQGAYIAPCVADRHPSWGPGQLWAATFT